MLGKGGADPSRWTPEMRFAASERMRKRMEALSPKERAALTARQLAGRAGTKAPRVKQEQKTPVKVQPHPGIQPLPCAGACPFVDQVVERVTGELLERLPSVAQSREAERVAVLAVKLARTPSRDPRWYDALGLLHEAAAEYAEHHPAIRKQADKAEVEP